MTKKDDIYKLIVKDLNNDITEEDKQLLEKALTQDKSLQYSLFNLRKFWKNFFPKPQSNTILEKTEKKLGLTYRVGSSSSKWSWLKVAASILFVASLTFSAYHLIKPKEQIVLNEYSTEAGETKKVILSDGTTVWLNTKSLLIASEPFVGDRREVKLFGEAYFDVAHNEEQPFIVNTPFLKTQVLGTRFNISVLNPYEKQEISLYEGKVKLISQRHNNEVILTPGERAYFSPESELIEVVRTDLGKPAQWRDGILRFYDEDLFSISKRLERKFQTRIFIADSIVGDLKYTAEFEEESLEMIMKILSEAHEFEFEFTNNGVLIKAKK